MDKNLFRKFFLIGTLIIFSSSCSKSQQKQPLPDMSPDKGTSPAEPTQENISSDDSETEPPHSVDGAGLVLIPGIVGTTTEIGCYAGPGYGYQIASELTAGQSFRVLGVDDGAAQIDDEITWFQINPNAFGDPDPPPLIDPSSADANALNLVYRCWVPGIEVEFSGDLSSLPVISRPILVTLEEVACYSGKQVAGILDTGQYFEILAVDDEITWVAAGTSPDSNEVVSIDDEITWIDDEITWFLIDPDALIDPDPPMLDRLIDPDPPMREGGTDPNAFGDPDPPPAPDPNSLETHALVHDRLCWIHRDAVRYAGDLARVAVIRVPATVPTSVLPTARPGPSTQIPTHTPTHTPESITCKDYTTFTACMDHANDGCAWDDKVGCFQE